MKPEEVCTLPKTERHPGAVKNCRTHVVSHSDSIFYCRPTLTHLFLLAPSAVSPWAAVKQNKHCSCAESPQVAAGAEFQPCGTGNSEREVRRKILLNISKTYKIIGTSYAFLSFDCCLTMKYKSLRAWLPVDPPTFSL